MTIDPTEAATSLQDIATVERRTREAMFYTGSSVIFIMWGVLVACGYGLTELAPHSAGIIWLLISSLGCAATAVIVAIRMHARPSDARDWRIIWAMIAMTAFGAAWSFVLGPVVPRQMMYAFQPSLFLLGLMLGRAAERTERPGAPGVPHQSGQLRRNALTSSRNRGQPGSPSRIM